MKSVIENLVFILIFLFLEAAVLSNITFFPVLPDFLLIITLYVSLSQGAIVGETNGFVSGLILDLLSAAPLGLNAIVRTLVGFSVGLLGQTININGIVVPVIFGGVGTILKALFLSFTAFFFPHAVYTYDLISPLLWQEMACNMVFTPVLFLFFRHFGFFDPVEKKL